MLELLLLVPHPLLDKLPHRAHIKALEGIKIYTESGINMMGKESTSLCESVLMVLIE